LIIQQTMSTLFPNIVHDRRLYCHKYMFIMIVLKNDEQFGALFKYLCSIWCATYFFNGEQI
jgi:hypothetical protein